MEISTLDEELRTKLEYTGMAVGNVFPEVKFALVLFDPTIMGGGIQFVSNGTHEQALCALKELVALSEGRRLPLPEAVQ